MSNKFRSTGFYVELILNVFFFVLLCAVAMNAFGAARQRQRASEEQARASAAALSAIESAKGDWAAGVFESGARWYYDETFTPCGEEGAFYEVEVTGRPGEGGLVHLRAAVRRGGEEIYTAQGAQYRAEEGAYEG